MRDIKPPVNFSTLEIDAVDSLDVPRPHHRQIKAVNKGLIALMIFIIAILFVAGGLAMYVFLLGSHPATELSTTSGNKASLSEDLTAKMLISKAKATIKGDAKETLYDPSGNSYPVFGAPSFEPIGYNFSVRPEQDFGFGSYGTKDTVVSDMLFVQKVLVDNGLKETILDPGSGIGGFIATYESDTIVCGVKDQKPYNEPATSPDYAVIIGCADTSSYQANAAMLRPYFIVYTSQIRTDTSKILFGSPTLKESKTAGYSTITIPITGSDYGSVGGFTGLFYVTPDKALHYFTGTQNQLPCRKFSTDDLKKAYLGEQCYDEVTGNDNAMVKL